MRRGRQGEEREGRQRREDVGCVERMDDVECEERRRVGGCRV